MLDKFTEKLLESAMSTYGPKLEELSKERVSELEAMKAKVRTDPEAVESWFDKEIKKAANMDVTDVMKKLK